MRSGNETCHQLLVTVIIKKSPNTWYHCKQGCMASPHNGGLFVPAETHDLRCLKPVNEHIAAPLWTGIRRTADGLFYDANTLSLLNTPLNVKKIVLLDANRSRGCFYLYNYTLIEAMCDSYKAEDGLPLQCACQSGKCSIIKPVILKYPVGLD